MSSLVFTTQWLATRNFSSVFQKVAIQLRFVISPLPTDLVLCSVGTPYLPELVLTSTLRSTYMELTAKWGGCGFRTQGFGDAHRPVGASSGMVLMLNS